MTDSNIDKFNKHAGFFLAQLYSSFPLPTLLDCNEAVHGVRLVGTGSDGAISLDDLQRASCDVEIRFCAHSLEWLHATGYFTGQARQHNIQFDRAVLTPKGFEALNATPNALQSKGSLGSQLREATSAAAGEAGRAAISEIVGQVVGAAARGFLGTTP